jgi:deoxyhypusine monooxygenase
MGAISAIESLPVLREHLSDPERSVRETCEIAIAKIEWDHSPEARQRAQHNSQGQGNPRVSYLFIQRVSPANRE